MARGRHRLTATRVAGLREPGRYADGDGLYLLVDATGNRRWIYRYWQGSRTDGRRRDLGLGALADVSLAQARAMAQEDMSLSVQATY